MAVKKRSYLIILLLFCLVVAVGVFHRSKIEVSEFKWLIEPRFEKASYFYKGVAWVQGEFGEPWKLIDKQGNVIVDNFQGEVPSFSFIDSKTELVAFRHKDGLWGYINLSGDVVISADYQLADTFQDGVAGVQKDGFYGVIDSYGEIVLPFKYERLWVGDSNMFAVKKDDKWEFVNSVGERVIDISFEQAMGEAFPGVYAVVLDKKWV